MEEKRCVLVMQHVQTVPQSGQNVGYVGDRRELSAWMRRATALTAVHYDGLVLSVDTGWRAMTSRRIPLY